MKNVQGPAVQDRCQLQVATINLIALHIGAYGGPDIYSVIVEKLERSDLREFAASIRNTIYHSTSSHPHSKEASNVHLESNIDELLKNSTSAFFSTLSSQGGTEQELKPMNVLRDITRLLELHVDDSIDISLQLIATCGIALSHIRQVIAYNQSSSLVRHCWMVLEALKGFVHVTASPQSRWSAISPTLDEITQQSNHNTCTTGTSDHVTSKLSDHQILQEIRDQQIILSLQMNQILSYLVSSDGSVGSCQDMEQIEGQQVSILELLGPKGKEF